MAHGKISELLPAPSSVVFGLLHDYDRRLEWDTLLRSAYLDGGNSTAGKGVTSVCTDRWWLGGFAVKTIYITFRPPTLAAVKMVNAPPFFDAWAASIHHGDLSANESRITYEFHFTAKPRPLRFILEPVMSTIFIWETRKRLRALRRYLSRTYRRV